MSFLKCRYNPLTRSVGHPGTTQLHRHGSITHVLHPSRPNVPSPIHSPRFPTQLPTPRSSTAGHWVQLVVAPSLDAIWPSEAADRVSSGSRTGETGRGFGMVEKGRGSETDRRCQWDVVCMAIGEEE